MGDISGMRKPVLAVDIDEVLAGFIPTLSVWHNELHGSSLTAVSFFSYEFHLVFDCTMDECNSRVDAFFCSRHFAEDIAPICGAKEALLRLKDHFDLHIVTARQLVFEGIPCIYMYVDAEVEYSLPVSRHHPLTNTPH